SRPERAVRYAHDAVGTELNFRVMSNVVSCARTAGSAEDMENMFDQEELLAPIREDFNRRHKR
ncbi:MAG: hypothetical protein J5973_00815, partial [Eubacterium sp.]|nr:hypothetical protein [Eubacterium sp.]